MAQHSVNGSKKSDSYKIITPVMMLANWNHKTVAFTRSDWPLLLAQSLPIWLTCRRRQEEKWWRKVWNATA
ncbi:hypothetical protein K443DRAFT_680133 [Laccaria amethystina LaAM-08-1]|uniref:Uncharacterized protein n=1 Tax=Laccaria amethystina LaAM-08-1 TaxID=1095629 RepID=A0A0C9XNT4_9AGAR|nr:hypothetical protein K443DRAFT_680133 [Laccaria amethystina LaAM-08-1]